MWTLVQLLSARDMAQKTFIGKDRIVYSTDRDLYEQDYEAKEWERRFREIEQSARVDQSTLSFDSVLSPSIYFPLLFF